MLEPDVGTAEVRDWLEREYGEGFELGDVGGISVCPPGAKLSHAAMNDDLNESLLD